jgi:hypothetical protein
LIDLGEIEMKVRYLIQNSEEKFLVTKILVTSPVITNNDWKLVPVSSPYAFIGQIFQLKLLSVGSGSDDDSIQCLRVGNFPALSLDCDDDGNTILRYCFI